MNTNHRPRSRRGENLLNGVSTGPTRPGKHVDRDREVGTSSRLGDFCMCLRGASVPRSWDKRGPDLSNLHSGR
jgi:hypothetical protein